MKAYFVGIIVGVLVLIAVLLALGVLGLRNSFARIIVDYIKSTLWPD